VSTESPRWSRLDPDVRRGEIVDAARRLFSTRPFQVVSITAIAEEAGVSRALVTHYFGGKRDLFMAVLQQLGEAGSMVPRTDLGLPIDETVARNVDAWLGFMEENRQISYAVASIAALDREPEVAQLVDDVRDAIVDRMLTNHFGTTEVPGHVRFVLRAYTGLVQVAVSDWLGGDRATRAQVHALMTRGLLALVHEVVPAVGEASAGGAGAGPGTDGDSAAP
jgi:AcrR family transcriptional regulator